MCIAEIKIKSVIQKVKAKIVRSMSISKGYHKKEPQLNWTVSNIYLIYIISVDGHHRQGHCY